MITIEPAAAASVSPPAPSAATPPRRWWSLAAVGFALRWGLPPVMLFILLVACWWTYVRASGVASIVVPPPAEVAATFLHRPGYLGRHMWVTAGEAVEGYALAVAVGVVFGTVIAMSEHLTRAVVPWLFAFMAMPKIALGPAVILWLGWDRSPKVFMAFLLSVDIVMFATVTGLRRLPNEYVELARSLTATRLKLFMKIRIKYALPAIFSGLKIAAPLSVIGAVLGELLSSVEGLGWTIRVAVSDTALVYAALVLLSITSMLLTAVVATVERLMLPWVRETTG